MTSVENLTPDDHQQALLATLATSIKRHTSGTGDFHTPVEFLGLYSRENPAPPASCIIEPSIVLVAQGAKQMWLGGEPFPYDVSRFLITSIGLPADSEVLTATTQKPCVGLVMKLDLRIVAELLAQGCLPSRRVRPTVRGVGIGTVTSSLLNPFVRLLELLDEPESIPALAPLIQREIHYRLLQSDQASKLLQIASVEGQGHRIVKAIDWLKLNYADTLRVDDLAARAQMSTATFHQHFRQLTAMSPLQYQKWLRLSEAKRLMLSEHFDVSSAAFRVGYESPSQFSREYSRQFGIAPKRDITQLRSQGRELAVLP